MQFQSLVDTKDRRPISRIIFRWAIYLLIAVVFFNVLRAGKYGLYQYLDEKGFSRSIFNESPLLYAKSIVSYLLSEDVFDSSGIPDVVIDVKFKDWKQLEKSRNNALSKGIIYKKEKKFVNATIRNNDNVIKAKVRLKGDFTDHLQGKKWSLRVKTKKDAHLFGMRSFSLQNPKTRGYIGEPLFLDMLRDNGILAPRYLFVREVINGEDVGVMALEEHFSKEIFEANGRKESVVLKLDETLFWESHANNNSEAYDDYTAAQITAFNSKKISKSPLLSSNYKVAVGLLRSFISGELQASDVFDVQLLGRYLAIIDIWGAWHAVAWHNIRFAYNPYTARLEPVGYDANTTDPKDVEDIPTENQNLAKRLLDDGYVRLAYLNSIKKLNDNLHDPSFIDGFNERGDYYLSGLRGEHLFIPDSSSILRLITKRSSYLYDKWINRGKIIVSIEECDDEKMSGWAVNSRNLLDQVSFGVQKNDAVLEVAANMPHQQFHEYNLNAMGLSDDLHGFSIYKQNLNGINVRCPQIIVNEEVDRVLISEQSHDISVDSGIDDEGLNYIAPAHAFLIRTNTGTYIEIENIVPNDFILSKLVVHDGNINEVIELSDPVNIPAKNKLVPYRTISIDISQYALPGNLSSLYTIFLESVNDSMIIYEVEVVPYFQKLHRLPMKSMLLNNRIDMHPYISVDKKLRKLTIEPGNHYISDEIVVPAGYDLYISPGTTLRFSMDSYILSFGSIIALGEKNNPIVMKSSQSEEGWGGVVAIGNGEQSTHLRNVLFNNVSTPNIKDWTLTGGITIYNNKIVTVDSCVFENNFTEDFVNIVGSDFMYSNSTIKKAISDGLDADFSDGTISGSSFLDIGSVGGGDAVDVSGSNVSVSDSSFQEINDKAISVGENSKLTGTNLTIENSGVGVASKDGSEVRINKSRISGSFIAGVMSYNKKREYGSSSMVLNGTILIDNVFDSIAQLGNQIVIDGEYDEARDVDVKALYSSLMKSGIK